MSWQQTTARFIHVESDQNAFQDPFVETSWIELRCLASAMQEQVLPELVVATPCVVVGMRRMTIPTICTQVATAKAITGSGKEFNIIRPLVG